jgi:serine/threonine protein kinase
MHVGTRLKGGRWHLDKLLASGGFSMVFSATHRNGSRAAIKILNSEFTEDEDMRARFLREGYAANKVGHPGVVRVLDDDVTEEGRAYLVMELLEGEALDARRDRLGGKIPLAEVLQIADELLDVLAAAHAQGIIHRDIKPANLFLTTKRQIKVLDFGFAKVKETAQGESTAVGTLLGTPGFLPPERARGQTDEVDARTDIWSAGATIFTLVSGVHVHEGRNPLDLLVATAQLPARSLASVEPGLPQTFIEAIDKALAFDKADRWPSASAMQEMLREAMVLEDQTKVGPLAPPTGASVPVTAVPRLYEENEDGGTKGFTKVLPSAMLQRPQVPAEPVAPPPHVTAQWQRRGPSLWPLVIGTLLALLGIAFGVAALFPAAP